MSAAWVRDYFASRRALRIAEVRKQIAVASIWDEAYAEGYERGQADALHAVHDR